MKKQIFTKKLIFLIASILIGLIGTMLLINNFFIDTKYSNKLYSPNKQYYVQVVEKNAGATTAYYSVVRVVNAESAFSNLGILSAWSGNRRGVFAYDGTSDSVQITWIDNNTLKIIYSNCQDINGQDNAWKNLKIVYDKRCEEE